MPIREKDKKLKRALRKRYGPTKGDRIFYSMESSDKLPSQKKAKPKKRKRAGR